MANPIGVGPSDFHNQDRSQATFQGVGPANFNSSSRASANPSGVGPNDSVIAGAGGGGGGGSPSALYMVAGNRIMTNNDTSFAAGTNVVRAFQQFLGIAGWDGYAPRGAIINARNTNGRLAYIANGFTIRKAGYMLVPPDATIAANGAITAGATAFKYLPVTFGGQASAAIPAGTTPSTVVSMHDELPDTATIPAGWRIYWQEAREYASTTDVFVPIVMTTSAFGNMGGFGERFMQATSGSSLDIEIGRPFSGNAGPTGGPTGLSGFFMKGCPADKLKDIYLFDSDSIGQGGNGAAFSNNSLVFANTDGEVFGGFKMAMNSPTGGRKFIWDIGTFASGMEKGSPVVYPEANATPSMHWTVKRIIALLGNVPFKRIANQQGHNDTNLTLPGMQGRLADLCTWYKANYQVDRIVWFGASTTASSANNAYWTNEADQTPLAVASVADAFNTWLGTVPLAGGNIDYYVPSQTTLQNGLKFSQTGLWSGTLATAITNTTTSTITVAGATAPQVGARLVFDPGGAEYDAGDYLVKTVTANGSNWDVLLNQQNGFSRNVAAIKTAGITIKETPVVDQEHYTARSHRRVRDDIVSLWKAAAFP